MSNGNVNSGTLRCVGKEEKVKRSGTFMKYVSLIGLILATAFALFMFAGCSKNTAAPDALTDDKKEFLDETTLADEVYAGPRLLEVTKGAASKVVGVLGGTINVVVDGSTSTFKVPAGALLLPVNITLDVTKVETPLGAIHLYDCGPDGTKFKLPAELSQPISTGQEYSFLYYFNEVTRQWELQEIVKVKDGVATFKIKHFSKYGIS